MNERRKPYPFHLIEPKWQSIWDERQPFHAPNPGDENFDATRPKFYILDMYPYPSGTGLHVGHPEGYTATDIVARYKRMRGFNVLHPMGWDAFGLPAEQYAIKTGQHPAITTRENVAKFKSQLKRIGFSYDWQREINTTDPAYFKWTQWIFLQLYRSWFNPRTNKAEPLSTFLGPDPDGVRLAFVAKVPVNWCPELGTVLANEEVIDGKSEVGGFPVLRRPMRQWMLRITAFAERLIEELDGLDWPEGIKALQRNWIGRSEGAEITFRVAQVQIADEVASKTCPTIEVFTTRPDTLYGATYMVLAPENTLVDQITTPEQRDAVENYRVEVASKSDRERTDLAKEKSGVFTGAFALNPVNEERIPIWIAAYVLMGYGTGAITGVPAHDERDFEFAQKFNLPIRRVIAPDCGIGFQPMNPYGPIDLREGACLPHWRQERATYAVCFRLVDSLPEDVLTQFRAELNRRADRADHKLTLAEQRHFDELHAEKIEAYLDSGQGACWLRDERIAKIVQDALLHFAGKRYELVAWAIMPNHVHAVVRPLPNHDLSQILHTWKSFTASAANRVLNRGGPFWQPESYDRLIRDEDEFNNQVGYVLGNPEKAGLKSWPWAGGIGFQPMKNQMDHRQDADATSMLFTGEGVAVNSPLIDGLPTEAAKEKITAWLEMRGVGQKTISYKLRDWLFSRQRYWGEPFPIVWRAGKHEPLPVSELPLEPPALDDFKPTGTGEPPLAKAKEWIRYSPDAVRETNTMPQWAGSCWYYLRFCDPQNNERFVGVDAERYWMGNRRTGLQPVSVHRLEADATKPGGVDLYVGGTEHAVLHLLYARFWHKVLFDRGYVSTSEPFQRLVNQGIILGEDGQKMSKSRGNVVNPDEVIEEYGADAFRCYEMFMGPLEQMKPWSMKGVEGVSRFLARVWRLVMEENQAGEWVLAAGLQATEPEKPLLRVLHATIKKVTEDIEALSFNTAISQMMICVNALTNAPVKPVSALRTLLVLLNPFAPHLTSELWQTLGSAFGDDSGDIAEQRWPEHEPAFLIDNEIEIVLQVNGKVRDRVRVELNATNATLESIARTNPRIREFTEGKQIRKVVVIPDRLVNVVTS